MDEAAHAKVAQTQLFTSASHVYDHSNKDMSVLICSLLTQALCIQNLGVYHPGRYQ